MYMGIFELLFILMNSLIINVISGFGNLKSPNASLRRKGMRIKVTRRIYLRDFDGFRWRRVTFMNVLLEPMASPSPIRLLMRQNREDAV
jgi:hypothetical protein